MATRKAISPDLYLKHFPFFFLFFLFLDGNNSSRSLGLMATTTAWMLRAEGEATPALQCGTNYNSESKGNENTLDTAALTCAPQIQILPLCRSRPYSRGRAQTPFSKSEPPLPSLVDQLSPSEPGLFLSECYLSNLGTDRRLIMSMPASVPSLAGSEWVNSLPRYY